jgi:hypothetical protein
MLADMIPAAKGPYNGGDIPFPGHADPNWDSRQTGAVLAGRTVAFIDQHHQQNLVNGTDTPFFIYYATPSIHVPITPPDTFNGMPVKGATGAGDLADMILELDLEVGTIIQALEERSLLRNTLIIFSSDNGPAEGVVTGHDRTAGLRGKKATMYEGGHRVPFIARWGDGTEVGSTIAPDSVSTQMISVHDWVATMYDLTNQNKPVDQAMDSMSILPVLLGQQPASQSVRDYMLLQAADWADPTVDHTKWHGIRRGDWVLLLNDTDTPVELYNLADDLPQMTNLIGNMQYAGVVSELVTVFTYARYVLDTDGDGIPDDQDNCIDESNTDQRDTDGDGYGNICDPDIDGNGVVDSTDLSTIKSVLRSSSSSDEDLNDNGVVDSTDYSIAKGYLRKPPGPSCCGIPLS